LRAKRSNPGASSGFWIASSQRYLPRLLERIEKGDIDPSFVVTHRGTLEQGPDLYKTFRNRKDGCIKVVLQP